MISPNNKDNNTVFSAVEEFAEMLRCKLDYYDAEFFYYAIVDDVVKEFKNKYQ